MKRLEVGKPQRLNDWPTDGPIDLSIHDLPHASSTIEWWYVNGHLITENGKELSVFASFFETLETENEQTGKDFRAHALTWAIIDPEEQNYFAESLLDTQTPKIALKQLENDVDLPDSLLKQSFKETFEKGNVPLPDQLMNNKAQVDRHKLALDFDGNQFVKLAHNRYRLKLNHKLLDVGCELVFELEKPPARHGKNGVVRGAQDEGMFYYFVPRCRVEGEVTLEGQKLTVKKGQGWYDHEFGCPAERTTDQPTSKVAWNWISAQLNNGYEVSGYHLVRVDTGEICGHSAIVTDPEGRWREYSDFSFEPVDYWTSSRTFERYPIRWTLTIPEISLSVKVETSYPEQEFVTLLSPPAFWEGRVSISGKMLGEAVDGLGVVERSGFSSSDSIADFLKAVSGETQKSLHSLLPLTPTRTQLEKLVASEGTGQHLEGLNPKQYAQTVIKPIRKIVDRGGKAWRSYAFLACLDIVGGNSQPFLPGLGWPELLHVGSLIIDDVQDKSALRRGGPSCHELYGEPLAINAGNACYFLAESLFESLPISAEHKLHIYKLYFETLRAAHAGQAIDLDGFADLMPEIVQSGNGHLLESQILCVYRLKSAVPASALAQAGALLGGGTKEQIEGLGAFFEALGISFQIMDDVLNLRGFKDSLKLRGEDIAGGKVTLPVAKAMSLLSMKKRARLWKRIDSKSSESEQISETILIIEKSGAIEDCIQQAEQLIKVAWKKLDRLVPDSQAKARLQAFSWYVLKRHY